MLSPIFFISKNCHHLRPILLIVQSNLSEVLANLCWNAGKSPLYPCDGLQLRVDRHQISERVQENSTISEYMRSTGNPSVWYSEIYASMHTMLDASTFGVMGTRLPDTGVTSGWINVLSSKIYEYHFPNDDKSIG